VTPSAATGVDDVAVSATVTNTGNRSGSDVAQLYLSDPASTGEPPRQLVGFERVSLAPGQSQRVQFTITPRDTSWWDRVQGGWSQSTGAYQVYVGDSSALANLPLVGSFRITSTPGARQVRVQAPRQLTGGRASAVRVQLTSAGNETLHDVVLALQLPQGWSASATTPTRFATVAPGQAPATTFSVRPPTWAPSTNEVVHATASLGGDARRENGVMVNVKP
jgi:beta-glucosidase